jgi:hypothetical protein
VARLANATPGLGAHPIALRVAEAGGLVCIDTVLVPDRGNGWIFGSDHDCSALEGPPLLICGDAPVC